MAGGGAAHITTHKAVHACTHPLRLRRAQIGAAAPTLTQTAVTPDVHVSCKVTRVAQMDAGSDSDSLTSRSLFFLKFGRLPAWKPTMALRRRFSSHATQHEASSGCVAIMHPPPRPLISRMLTCLFLPPSDDVLASVRSRVTFLDPRLPLLLQPNALRHRPVFGLPATTTRASTARFPPPSPPHSDLHALPTRPARFTLKRCKPYPLPCKKQNREQTPAQGLLGYCRSPTCRYSHATTARLTPLTALQCRLPK